MNLPTLSTASLTLLALFGPSLEAVAGGSRGHIDADPQVGADPQGLEPVQIQLPEGTAADRAMAGVGPETPLAPEFSAGLSQWPSEPSSAAWQEPEPWLAWSSALKAEARAEIFDASRRGRLAHLALAQGRFDDAWGHFAATTGDPSITASLLPRFLPGLRGKDLEQIQSAQTWPVLENGVLLRPALPPSVQARAIDWAKRGRLERRSMRLNGLRIGDAVMDMHVRVEAEGLQIDFTHRSGGEAKFRIQMPELEGFEKRVQYADWYRIDPVEALIPVLLLPIEEGDDEEERVLTVFARYRSQQAEWPTELPSQLPRAVADSGLCLEWSAAVPAGDQGDQEGQSDQGPDQTPKVLTSLAAGFSDALGLPVLVSKSGAQAQGSGGDSETDSANSCPLVLRFVGNPLEQRSQRAKLARMVSLAEQFVLRR